MSKNETKQNFIKSYIRTSGEGSPEFTGPDLPEGMTVRDLVTIHYGDTAFLSLEPLSADRRGAGGRNGSVFPAF